MDRIPGYTISVKYARLVVTVCASLCAGIAPAPAAAQSGTGNAFAAAIDTMLLREATRVLAADSLRGRETGSPGGAMAVRYIVRKLRETGLEPGARDGSFTQPVPIRRVTVDATSQITVGAIAEPFVYGADFFVTLPDSLRSMPLRGDAWFAGTPHDAAAALDPGAARGRFIVVLGALPARGDTTLAAWAANGATGVIQLQPDSAAWADAFAGTLTPQMRLDDAPPFRPGPPLPVITAGPRLTRALVQGVTIPAAIAGTPFRAIDLGRDVGADIRVVRTPIDAVNVVGMLPGSDPALRDRLIVYAAHYDHLGTGRPDETGDSIYNGFSDDAAGVAMLLSIADALRREPPARSVAFLFLTGEERGLLGSTHAARMPPWTGGLDRVDALINLDGGAPPRPPIAWRFPGGLAPDRTPTRLGTIADSIDATNGWATRLETARPISDFWPFGERGVPAIFIIPGAEWEDTSKEEHDALFARWDHYHQPADEYDEDFPFAGIARYAALALMLGQAVDARSR
ncbi:MAG: M28 family peptidase [Gemmatimonadota bacterium]|jgi:hypothetical protein